MKPKPDKPKPPPSRAWRVTRFVLCSIASGGLLGMMLWMAAMIYSAIVYKDRFVVGGGPDPGGVALLGSIVYGGLGSAAGAVVGAIGGIFIFFRSPKSSASTYSA